jgi:hypothetical protein
LFTSKIDWSDKSWSPDEIMGQVMISRLTPGNGGTVHFSMRALTQDRQRVASGLRDGAYAGGALVPASPWLDDSVPPAPTSIAVAHIPPGEYNEPTTRPLPHYPPTQPTTQPFLPLTTQPVEEVEKKKKLGAVRVTWKSGEGEPAWVWAVYTKHGDNWSLTVVPGHVNEAIVRDVLKQIPASVVAVAAVDRCGNESKRTIFETGLKPPPKPATTQAAPAATQNTQAGGPK